MPIRTLIELIVILAGQGFQLIQYFGLRHDLDQADTDRTAVKRLSILPKAGDP